MAKITAIIPTYNEEHNIRRALDSVHFADEIIVIDSYSTDSTVEIVKSRPEVKLLQRKFDNFSAQKNYAIQQATHDWIFLLDADEEVPQKLKEEIESVIANSPEEKAFHIYRTFFFKTQILNYSGWQRDKVIRLFKKDFNNYKGKVHETIDTNGRVGFLKNKLNHYSYTEFGRYKCKLKKYARLQAEELEESGQIVTPYHFFLKPLIRFVIHFIIKLGFLDGMGGLVISYLHGYGVYRRYAELIKIKMVGYRVQKKKESSPFKIGYDAKRIYHNSTGLGNYSRDLIKILSHYFPENQYILFNPKPKTLNRLSPNSQIKEVLPKSKIWKTFSSIWRQSPMIRQVIDEDVSIFHGLSGEVPIGIKTANIKTVVTIHDLIFIRYPELYSWGNRMIYFQKFKYAAKQADVVIAISEQTKRDIVEFLDISEEKIQVIYQGCHEAFKQEAHPKFKNEVREKYKLPERFVLNVGTIEERKNLLTVVKGIQGLEIPLVVVGKKTKYAEKVIQYIEDNGMQKQVSFVEGGSMEELAAIYQMAELFAYPSIFEGFGIPIIEALYSKTPVITTAGGVFPEAGGSETVYINDPMDAQEMQAAIVELLDSKEKRAQIAQKSFEFVQKFNDENIAQQMMAVYRGLVE